MTNGSPTLRPRRRARVINGREYFRKYEREMRIDELSADAVEQLEDAGLKDGPVFSKAGGNIARDLKMLSPEETASRRKRSEAFLKRPTRRVPAEDPE